MCRCVPDGCYHLAVDDPGLDAFRNAGSDRPIFSLNSLADFVASRGTWISAAEGFENWISLAAVRARLSDRWACAVIAGSDGIVHLVIHRNF